MKNWEQQLHDAAEGFLVGLRQGKGFDLHASEQLRAGLQLAVQELQGSELISKSLANLFVDLAGGIAASAFAYKGQEADQVLAFADEVADLVRRCVSE